MNLQRPSQCFLSFGFCSWESRNILWLHFSLSKYIYVKITYNVCDSFTVLILRVSHTIYDTCQPAGWIKQNFVIWMHLYYKCNWGVWPALPSGYNCWHKWWSTVFISAGCAWVSALLISITMNERIMISLSSSKTMRAAPSKPCC